MIYLRLAQRSTRRLLWSVRLWCSKCICINTTRARLNVYIYIYVLYIYIHIYYIHIYILLFDIDKTRAAVHATVPSNKSTRNLQCRRARTLDVTPRTLRSPPARRPHSDVVLSRQVRRAFARPLGGRGARGRVSRRDRRAQPRAPRGAARGRARRARDAHAEHPGVVPARVHRASVRRIMSRVLSPPEAEPCVVPHRGVAAPLP